jgi:predicted ATPase
MKAAEVADFWRRALKRSYGTCYVQVAFNGIRRIGSGSLSFAPGMTAVIGGNGVGKSTLMSTVLRTLGPIEDERLTKLLGDPTGTEIKATVTTNNGQNTITIVVKDNDTTFEPAGSAIPPSKWIDPSTLATEVRSTILRDAKFSENLEGVDPIKLSDEDMRDLSYLVGRDYQSIAVYELEDYGGYDVFPYFRVSVDGVDYDSADMGLGELSLFLIHWTLRSLASQTIVLIEEPETHVSPRSQERLMDVCARYCSKKELSLIVTTHSPFVISRMRREQLRLIVRNAMQLGVVIAPSPDQVARVLGDRLTYHGALVVEDDLARAIARAILRNMAPELIEYFEIVVVGSNGDIVKALASTPKLRNWFSLVGLFDGDQRSGQKDKSYAWPHLFLPSDRSPEALLRATIEKQKDNAAGRLGSGVDQLNAACDQAQGADNHDWIRTVRQALQLEIPAFVDPVVQLWLEDENNRTEAELLVTALRQYVYMGAWAA